MASGDSIEETVRRPMGGVVGTKPPAAQLRVVFPLELAATIKLDHDELVLGRRPGDYGYKLDDPTVSRRHFAVRWLAAARQYGGIDLGSRNGTFVKNAGEAKFEKVVEQTALPSDSEFALGNARFKFVVVESDE